MNKNKKRHRIISGFQLVLSQDESSIALFSYGRDKGSRMGNEYWALEMMFNTDNDLEKVSRYMLSKLAGEYLNGQYSIIHNRKFKKHYLNHVDVLYAMFQDALERMIVTGDKTEEQFVRTMTEPGLQFILADALSLNSEDKERVLKEDEMISLINEVKIEGVDGFWEMMNSLKEQTEKMRYAYQQTGVLNPDTYIEMMEENMKKPYKSITDVIEARDYEAFKFRIIHKLEEDDNHLMDEIFNQTPMREKHQALMDFRIFLRNARNIKKQLGLDVANILFSEAFQAYIEKNSVNLVPKRNYYLVDGVIVHKDVYKHLHKQKQENISKTKAMMADMLVYAKHSTELVRTLGEMIINNLLDLEAQMNDRDERKHIIEDIIEHIKEQGMMVFSNKSVADRLRDLLISEAHEDKDEMVKEFVSNYPNAVINPILIGEQMKDFLTEENIKEIVDNQESLLQWSKEVKEIFSMLSKGFDYAVCSIYLSLDDFNLQTFKDEPPFFILEMVEESPNLFKHVEEGIEVLNRAKLFYDIDKLEKTCNILNQVEM